jgi:hypothetical protein
VDEILATNASSQPLETNAVEPKLAVPLKDPAIYEFPQLSIAIHLA